MDQCYSCVHRREVPGSAHSSCAHPVTAPVHANPYMALAAQVGKRGGRELIRLAEIYDGEGPLGAAASLNIEAHQQGVENGWFIWPVNFDPVWLQRCDGFTPKDGNA